MVDPVTVNRGLAIPTRGSDVGTWDVPINGDMALLDTIVGGVASISTTGGTTTLNAAQLASGTISVSGALASNAIILFPAVQGWWTIENLTTNIGFGVFVACGGSGTVIGIPPGEIIDIQINTNTPKYRGLGRVGSYLDLAASAVPVWIASSTTPPYLLCDGSSFSGATFPVLAAILSGTTLPDWRGRGPYFLNGGTGRLTAAGAGIDGNTLFAAGGTNGVTLASNQVPSLTSSNAAQNISVRTNNIVAEGGTINTVGTPGSGTPVVIVTGVNQPLARATSTDSNSISVAYTNASQQIISNAAPGLVGGIRLIRAG